MTQPTYFTVTADFRVISADSSTDLNADPELVPLSAAVTFKPVLKDGDVILAVGASPRPTGFVPAAINASITDGRLVLRETPDGEEQQAATLSALPATGNPAKYYVVADTGAYYRWTGSGYVEIAPYQPVRLLADTPLLGLEADSPLYYQVIFTDVMFNGQSTNIKKFSFQAPVADIEVSLIEVMPHPRKNTGRGINAPMLLSAFFNDDDELVFVNADSSELTPIEVPAGVAVFTDNGDSTWTVG